MGRKRTHREASRTKTVSARLRLETYDLITEHADKLGLTRSGYIEHLIENRPLQVVQRQSDELGTPLLNELKRIGNNLNQIAQAHNSGVPTDPRHFKTVLAEIIRILCSNETLRRRYEAAAADAGVKPSDVLTASLPLRNPAAGVTSGEAQSSPAAGMSPSRPPTGQKQDQGPPFQLPPGDLFGAGFGLPVQQTSATEPAFPPALSQASPQHKSDDDVPLKKKANSRDHEAPPTRAKFPWSMFVRPARR
jgi:hypothetical protein